MHSHILSGLTLSYADCRVPKYTIYFTTFVTKRLKLLVHIFKVFRRSCTSVNVFHESKKKIIIFKCFNIIYHKDNSLICTN